MKFLGIDYGTKKVGLATSDESGSVAFPYAVIPNDLKLFEEVLFLLRNEDIQNIVMGHSTDMKGGENPVMQEAHSFKERLEKEKFIVHLEPEFLTTFQAKRNTEDAMADAAAAALILQSFLDKETGEV